MSGKNTKPNQDNKKSVNLLSTDAVNPLSSSASITTTGEDPGTAIGLDAVPKTDTPSSEK